MRIFKACLALLLTTIVTPSIAADPEAGKARAVTCLACHGQAGISQIPTVPILAGQQDKFLQWQLVFFRSGRRANPIMGPLSADLTDEDVRNLGAYFASLPPSGPPTAQADPALREEGRLLVERNRCAACHTDSFNGKQAAPGIARQHKDYLVKSLTDYRSSARPSVGVAAMTEAAARLSDEDIVAIAAFLETYQ